MHQELLVELVKRAHIEKSVAFSSIADGLQMLVYPLEHDMLVGIGLETENTHQIDTDRLLYKRAGDMARFGSWLPARLQDGSWYVVKRVPVFNIDSSPLEESDLEAAMELLS